MSRFVQRFESHHIHTYLTNAATLINDLTQIQNTPDAITEIERIRQIITYTQELLDNCDPNFLNTSHLESIANGILNTNSNLQSYKSSQNETYLQHANNQLDNILSSYSYFLRALIPQDIEGTRKSIISFRASVTAHLRNTEEEFNKIKTVKSELEQGLQQVSSTVDIQKSRLDTAIAEYQNQFSQAEEARREQFSQAEATRSENFSTNEEQRKKIVDENEVVRSTVYSQEMRKHTELFEQMSDSLKDAIRLSIEDFQKTKVELEEEFVVMAQTYLEVMEKYKNQAAQNLNMISVSSMAGGYKKVADEEGKSRVLWRRTTMAAMILLVGTSVWSFLYPFEDGTLWTEIARRIFVAGTFATVAGYSARQAKIHLIAERRYRKMELELTALNPYLAELDDSKRKEVLEKLAGTFFGTTEAEVEPKEIVASNQESSTNGVDVTRLLDVIQSILPNKK